MSATPLGDVERVVGIVIEAVEQLAGGLERQHVARIEIGLRIEIENLPQVASHRRPHQEFGLVMHGAAP